MTAGDVIERRDRLASGLRRQEGCVWPETDPDAHAGRLILWVGDKPMAKAKPVPWPLAKVGKVDLFAPFPLGVDPRGRTVTVTLMFASVVIGAVPRMGKSFLLRLLLLAAALDVTCRLYVFDLKGGPDLLPLEPVAYRFRVGDDHDDMTYLLTAVRELHQDMPRRYRTLRSLPREVCPEGKVTPAIAANRTLGLYPVVLAIDECQRAFEHGQYGSELTELITDLNKRGPAVGIIVVNATQRIDAKSLPPSISSNAILRFALKVAGQVENDMVLGTSSYKAGIRATMFSRTDRGIGYLVGEGDDPIITKVAYLDAPAAETIVARARANRVAAGRLDGHAAGLDPDPDTSTASILDHLAAVWPVTSDKASVGGTVLAAWCDDLAGRLAATYPGLYAGWTGEQVTSAVKPHGIRSKQIKRTIDGQPVNRRGLTRQSLADALTNRDQPWPDPAADAAPAGPDQIEAVDQAHQLGAPDRAASSPQDAPPGLWTPSTGAVEPDGERDGGGAT